MNSVDEIDDRALEQIYSRIEPLRTSLLNHRVYQQLTSIEAVRIFMEHHCYPVTDFMCLLKSLQQRLTVLSVPWFPAVKTQAARFINEIVVAEESDVARGGGYISHYEMYLEAMEEVGANTQRVTHFVEYIRNKQHYRRALKHAEVPAAAQAFVQNTMQVCLTGKNHEVAASFVFGRENLIPELFTKIIKGMQSDGAVDGLLYYLERHVEIDGDEHGPAAILMLKGLCEGNKRRWVQAENAAVKALTSRLVLWDAIADALDEL